MIFSNGYVLFLFCSDHVDGLSMIKLIKSNPPGTRTIIYCMLGCPAVALIAGICDRYSFKSWKS